MSSRLGRGHLRVLLLVAIVTAVWCATYNRFSPASFAVPLAYGGDALGQMTGAKAVARGEIFPFLPKYPTSFGAPFAGNWNDYPGLDEAGLAWSALLAALFGVFTGANVAVLTGHVFAGLSFYYVCRKLRYAPGSSLVTAVLFALSPYAFARGLGHLTLTYYWHVPLGILAVYYCLRSSPSIPAVREILFCVAVALIHAFQNPYYTGLLIQFLAAAAVYQLVRRSRWERVVYPVALACVTVLGAVVANLDSVFHRQSFGPNPASVVRTYGGLEIYALKPLELFLPLLHRWDDVRTWTVQNYTSQAHFLGEIGGAYIGIVAIVGAVLLGYRALRHWAVPRATKVPHELWFVGWILLYSAPGGLNGLLGTTGFVFFRATNRYSIVVLAFLLLFVARYVGSITRAWSNASKLALATAVLAVGIWDQAPDPLTSQQLEAQRAIVADDASLVAQIERAVPPGAMIFQLPVMDFPEVPPHLGVSDYEHFRPYMHSRHLRFSYGSNKGRPRERWQHELPTFGNGGIVELERYGFSAVLINVKGYTDRGEALLREMAEAGRGLVVARSRDFVCVRLWPVESPTAPPTFGAAWYPLERTRDRSWRWSSGSSAVTLYNLGKQESRVRLAFGLETPQPRNVLISVAGQRVHETQLRPGGPTPVELIVTLPPGSTDVLFATDVPGAPPSNGDPRPLAFAVSDFVAEKVAAR